MKLRSQHMMILACAAIFLICPPVIPASAGDGSPVSKEEVSELLAETYLASGQHEKAAEMYAEIVEREQGNVEARIKLADVLSWLKKYDESLLQYRMGLEIAPGNPEITRKIASVSSWKGDLDTARLYYMKLVDEGLADTNILLDLSDVLIRQVMYKKALYYIDQAELDESSVRGSIMRARVLLYSGKYEASKELLESLIKETEDSKDLFDLNVMLADTYAYSKRFSRAIELYEALLAETGEKHLKRKLADVLSWDKQYQRAVDLYSEILEDEYDPLVHRQKARVLGWARRYSESENEYIDLLNIEYDRAVMLEYGAKKANRFGMVRTAIAAYNDLIAAEPENYEAIFDLAQIYSYRAMWRKAINEYDRILAMDPAHFRSKEAREKVLIISSRPSLMSRYRFYEADSAGRDMDMRIHEVLSGIAAPLDEKTSIELDHAFRQRKFSDHYDIAENEGRISISRSGGLNWHAGGYYGLIGYSKGKDNVFHIFGANIGLRIFDHGEYYLRQDRERLQNNSEVIKKDMYRDVFRNIVFFDVTDRLKAGAEYNISRYSDSNFLHEPALELLYHLFMAPKNLSLRYRFQFTEFRQKVPEYFSPRGFSTNAITVQWRHFLNKEEIFFGADDFYYDIKYSFSLDSEEIVGHKFSGELNWDITKRFNLNVSGSVMNSSAGVYEESEVIAGIRYYF